VVLFHGRPDFSAADSPFSSTRFDSSPPSSSLPLPLPLTFLFHRAVGPSASLPLPSRGRSQTPSASLPLPSRGRSQRGGRTTAARPPDDASPSAASSQRVPARRPHDASPSAATGVGRRQRGGAASSRYAFLTLKIYVPRPFLDMFRDVPVLVSGRSSRNAVRGVVPRSLSLRFGCPVT
jgi:hypothetical protein